MEANSNTTQRAMYDFLEEEFKRYKRIEHQFTILLGDIEWFKSFNDTHGHDCGDYVISELSMLLSTSIRKIDKICRWNGEEYLFYL